VKEPVDLRARAEEDAAQDEARDARGIFQPVGQRQGAAPRAAEKKPLFHAQVRPQFFHVGHEIAGGVVVQLAERHRTAAATLVEHHDAVELRVEEAAMHRRRTGARPAMQEQHGDAVGIAALLPIDRVPPVDGQHSAGVGRDLGKQIGAKRGL
jgi:hypothetical protein